MLGRPVLRGAARTDGARRCRLRGERRGPGTCPAGTSIAEFNLGTGPQDFTVPDGGVVAAPTGSYAESALLVVEVLSPDDATFDKFAHYSAHGVPELVLADPRTRAVRCWPLQDAGYVETPGSELLERHRHRARCRHRLALTAEAR